MADPATMGARDELLAAVKAGDAAAVRATLARDPALADARDSDGISLLLTALYRGHAGVVEALRDDGAPPDVFDAAALGETSLLHDVLDVDSSLVAAYSPDGWTALHLAAHFGQTAAAEALLAAGADIATRSRNPLENQPLHAAVAGNAPAALVRSLIAHGADVGATQRGGFTPLHGAAQNGNLTLVRLLLDAGADPEACSDDGKTARDFAAEEGHGAVVRTLDLLGDERQAREQIRRVVEGINQAWARGRPEEMAPYLDDDVVLVQPGFQERAEGRAAALASYRELVEQAATHDYGASDVSIRVWGDTAVATYRYAIDYERDGALYHDTGYDIVVLHHKGGRWRVVWRTLSPERSGVVGATGSFVRGRERPAHGTGGVSAGDGAV